MQNKMETTIKYVGVTERDIVPIMEIMENQLDKKLEKTVEMDPGIMSGSIMLGVEWERIPLPHQNPCVPWSTKLLKGGYIGDYIEKCHRGY